MSSRIHFPAVAATFMTLVTLFALTGYQLTTQTAGARLLGRVGGALVEIDRWLPANQEDLELQARDSRQEALTIRDLPVKVSVPAALFIDPDLDLLRRVIMNAMGQSLYRDGNQAFAQEEGQEPSLRDRVYWTVGSLSSDAHTMWRLALPACLVVLALASGGVLLARGSLVLPIAIGATLGAVASGAAWLLFDYAAGNVGTTIDREILLIISDGAFLGLRNSAAFAIPLALVLVLSQLLGRQSKTWQEQIPEPADLPRV